MYSSTLSLTSALGGGGWSTPRPGRLTSEKDPVPIVQSGPQCRSGRMREISPPTGIRSPARSALASRYTDWAIAAHFVAFFFLVVQQKTHLVMKVLLGTVLYDRSDKILLYLLEWLYIKTYRIIKFYGRSLEGLRHCILFIVLRPPACWDGGFESRRGRGCLSLVNVVSCKVDVCAPGWSLVQRGST